MNYGIPYMGSKAKIIKQLLPIFPRAEHFYDLFGGGFSVTHGMLVYRSEHFKHFHFNEIRPGVCDLIRDAVAGKYSYKIFKPKWISREEFFATKEFDSYVKLVWSFGNDGKYYIFGKDIEPLKKSLHQAVVFNEFDDYAKKIFGTEKFAIGLGITERRLFLKNRLRFLKEKRCDFEQLEQLEQLERLGRLSRLQQLEQLERLQQLEQLEQLERLGRLSLYTRSYENIPIEPNSVIYCDIPYGGTHEYDSNSKFNRVRFFDWADQMDQPVFISEYAANDTRFRCVWNEPKRSLISQDKTVGNKIEKVFVNRAGYAALMRAKNG